MNIKQKSNEFRRIVNEMADLYEKKNSNYGDSFGQLYSELGPTSGLVPLWNKLHRATSLIKGDINNFESLEDTLKDLACYAIMNLIEMKSTEVKKVCVNNIPNDIDFMDEYNKNIIAPDDTGTLTFSNFSESCKDCSVYKQYSNGLYVGDLPCQWCNKNNIYCKNGSHAATGTIFKPLNTKTI